MSTETNTGLKEQFIDDLQEFVTKWKALPYEQHRIENQLTGDANRLAEEIRARTCPSWCSKALHAKTLAYFWVEFSERGSEIHSKDFGDGIVMGDPDGISGVRLFFAVDAFGNVVDKPLNRPQIEVQPYEQETVA